MKRLYAFYQAHDVTDLADIEKDVSAIITKGRVRNRPDQELLVPDWLITSHVT